jgi:type II secretory pathway predicted ATPase ExeA
VPDDVTSDSPFAPVLARQFFLETLGAAEALRRLDDGLGAREPFLLITGDPGTGKSTLVNQAITRWGPRVSAAYLAYPAATNAELLEQILQRFGATVPEGASRPKLVASVENALADIAGRGQVAVIVVDDAHHLSAALLEELRLLVNAAHQARRPLEIMLVGLPALEATIDDPALEALRQRIAVRAKLQPLSPGETRRYIRHRIAATGDDRSNLFPRKTCAEIAVLSHGVPRQINALAGEALRLARDAGHPTVDPSHVRAAVAALSGVLPKDEREDGVDLGSEASSSAIPATLPTAKPTATSSEQPSPAQSAKPAAPPGPKPIAASSEKPSPAQGAKPAAPPSAKPTAAPSAKPSIKPVDPAAASAPVPVTSQDAREWVARFIGDKGPLQIGSQVMASRGAPSASWGSFESEAGDPDLAQFGDASAEPRKRASDGEPRSRHGRGGALRLVTTVSLVCIALAALVMIGLRATGGAQKGATSGSSGAKTASLAPQRQSGGAAGAAAKDSKSTPVEDDTKRADRASEPATSRPEPPYTLDTGGRLDLETAYDERERIQALTGIEGWVVPIDEPGADKYHVVLGIFRSYSRARSAAAMLTRSKTLSSVTVITLPPRTSRQ